MRRQAEWNVPIIALAMKLHGIVVTNSARRKLSTSNRPFGAYFFKTKGLGGEREITPPVVVNRARRSAGLISLSGKRRKSLATR